MRVPEISGVKGLVTFLVVKDTGDLFFVRHFGG